MFMLMDKERWVMATSQTLTSGQPKNPSVETSQTGLPVPENGVSDAPVEFLARLEG